MAFLEKQAAERETERDEFSKKIEMLESKLRDVDKERLKYDNIAREVCSFNKSGSDCWIAVLKKRRQKKEPTHVD